MSRKKSAPPDGSSTVDKGSLGVSATAGSALAASGEVSAPPKPAIRKKRSATSGTGESPLPPEGSQPAVAPRESGAASGGGAIDGTLETNGTSVEDMVSRALSASAEEKDVGQTGVAVDRDAIAHRAWEIWLSEGCPEGRDVEHWLRAESELSGRPIMELF